MNLSTFESYVKSLLNDPALDALILPEIRNAGLWMEANYSFYYMESFRAFTQAAGDRYVTLNARPKRIALLRQVLNTGEYRGYDQVDPRDIDEDDFSLLGSPSVFWLDGRADQTQPAIPRLVLNLTPTTALNLEILEIRLTDWDGLGDSAGHWLFDYARAALAYRTLYQIFALPLLRDAEGMQMVAPVLKDALDTAIALDDELRRSVRSDEMRYGRGV